LVARLVYGLASTVEVEQAHRHLERCGRCTAFAERLEIWREKAGALLPVPAAEAASPGLLERIADRAAHAIGSVKRQVLGGGAQIKQQAAASCTRAVDPTPLAGARPSAVAAVVAGCIAVGGGATYCAQQGLDPLGPLADLSGGQETQQQEPPAPPESTEPTPVVTPTPVEEPPEGEVTYEAPPAQESAPEQKAEPAPEPEPEPEPEPPPPEASFEPSSPEYPTEAEPEDAAAPTVTPQPKAVAANEAPQFGGP
jgi:hypothetical protein